MNKLILGAVLGYVANDVIRLYKLAKKDPNGYAATVLKTMRTGMKASFKDPDKHTEEEKFAIIQVRNRLY